MLVGLFTLLALLSSWMHSALLQVKKRLQVSEARMQANLALKESEERFRVTFNQAAVGIAHVALDGRWLRVNQKLCDIVGYTESELLERTFQDITHPDDLDTDLAYLQQLLAGEIQTYSIEKRYIRPCGHVWVNLTVSPARDALGEPKYLISVMEDISERKQAESALRQSEERLRLALEAGQLGIWDWNVLTDKVTWSDGAEQLFGLVPGTFGRTCKSFLDYIHPEDRESTVEAMTHAFDAKTGYDIEFRIIWPEGSIRWMTAKSQLFCDENGKAVRVVGTNLDVTERKQAELVLQQQTERERLLGLISQRIRQSLNLKDILDTTVAEVRQFLQTDRVLIYRFEPDGSGIVEVESVAPSCLPIHGMGYDPCGNWLEHYQQGFQATDNVYATELEQLQFNSLTQFQIEDRLVVPILQGKQLWGLLIAHHCSGSRQWQQVEIDLLSSLATQVAIAIRQAQLYEATLAQVEALERLNQLKDDFLSTVSHELRTPISNMKMSIRMLEIALNQRIETETSKASRYLQILRDECEREIRLINDLLDWQQLEAGVRPKELEIIQLQAWLPQIVEPFRERTNQQQQFLQIDIDPELPPLLSDNASLERILTELLNNACKYTPPGERITVTAKAVETRHTTSARRTLFQVSNSGVEIPASELPRIFDRFYRIRRADRWQRGGTGLGLALVQKLTEHLGGTLVAESALNQTSFTVDLPVSLIDGN